MHEVLYDAQHIYSSTPTPAPLGGGALYASMGGDVYVGKLVALRRITYDAHDVAS